MKAHYDAGYHSFDFADIYGDAELIYKDFRKTLSDPSHLNGLTKWVPRGGRMTRPIVEAAIRERLTRMGVDSLDMIQFHWWDYSDKAYLDALRQMKDLQKEGLIKNLALTNFDSVRLEEIIHAGIPVVSNQVQYSLIDTRPEVKMKDICLKHNVKLLTYGTLCGGFFANKYLGAPEPQGRAKLTPSQGKYLQMITAWGGWTLFQEMLLTLKKIGDRHNVSVANVAIRYVLEQPFVGGVIVGARLGVSENINDNLKVFSFALTEQDYAEIEAVQKKSRRTKMFEIIGDCGDEYRK
jgi:aryl-alcohol dehydrogenase-like predicted oxidoreductase